MKDYLGTLLAKLKAVIKPSIWSFVPLLAAQLKAAIAAKDTAKILEIAARLRASAHEEREHADSVDALAAHLEASVAPDEDGVVEIDAIEVAEALDLLQTVIDEGEDIATGKDEDDAVPPV
jgi:hypothetical protein